MAVIDVCNGDADGLFAVLQLRLAEPERATLVTGRKHEIALLEQVYPKAGDRITVCDVSLDRNVVALARVLEAGASVRYFDHHSAKKQFQHRLLACWIDTDPALCTSLIVDRYLGGRFGAWAAAAAWGDNLAASANALCDRLKLDTESRKALQALGESVNYNAYGASDEDCLIAPGQLYERLARYREPFAALDSEPVLRELQARRADDLGRALALEPWRDDIRGRIWMLPDAAWARRVVGPFANLVAAQDPGRPHAGARRRADGALDLSVRSPLDRRAGAARLCAAFGGGGREAAGAIEALPAASLEAFAQAFAEAPWGETER
ncbi:MAG: hypothetical protein ACKODB_01565 [Betaproteobacteria bacterium]